MSSKELIGDLTETYAVQFRLAQELADYKEIVPEQVEAFAESGQIRSLRIAHWNRDDGKAFYCAW
jgi:hypothetical protein